jgi:hypothetical protein
LASSATICRPSKSLPFKPLIASSASTPQLSYQGRAICRGRRNANEICRFSHLCELKSRKAKEIHSTLENYSRHPCCSEKKEKQQQQLRGKRHAKIHRFGHRSILADLR